MSNWEDYDYVLKAIRFPSKKLVSWVDKAIAKIQEGERYAGDRSDFVTQAAASFAKTVLARELSPQLHLLPQNHIPRAVNTEETVRTNIMIPLRIIATIEEAARRLHHHVSPFLAWAALLKARQILGYYPEISSRSPVTGQVSPRDTIEYSTLAVRFPIVAIHRMDTLCKQEKIKRSRFLEEALFYTIQKRIVENNTIDLLPENHSLNGDKKMVSFKLPISLRNDADAAGATMNHNTTGFLVFASLIFLNKVNSGEAQMFLAS